MSLIFFPCHYNGLHYEDQVTRANFLRHSFTEINKHAKTSLRSNKHRLTQDVPVGQALNRSGENKQYITPVKDVNYTSSLNVKLISPAFLKYEEEKKWTKNCFQCENKAGIDDNWWLMVNQSIDFILAATKCLRLMTTEIRNQWAATSKGFISSTVHNENAAGVTEKV